jgi:RNA polymerase sigma-70 factor (ECF subfamily)
MIELPTDCVSRIRGGDLAAFEALYRAMHPALLAFGARYTGDTSRAEELVQDLFFDLWRGREAWVVTGSVTAYLYTALRNRALNLRRRDAVEMDWAEDEAHEPVRALHPSPRRLDAELESAEVAQQLAAAMARLPERCGVIMQMRWHGGLSYAEIASVLGISRKGVENQLSRGLKALRAEFGVD